NPDVWPGAIVGRIMVGHNGIQSIVSAREFGYDENPLRMPLMARSCPRLRGKRSRSSLHKERQRRTDADSVQSSRQKLATGTRTFACHRSLFFKRRAHRSAR